MKRWWVKIVLGLGAILLVLVGLLLTSRIHSKNAVEQYKDELRASGEKLSVDELIPPQAPAGRNGLRAFHDAERYMGDLGLLYSNPPPAMRMVAPGKAMIGWQQPDVRSSEATNSWAEIAFWLNTRGSALDSLRETAESPQLDFYLDYRNAFDLLLPHLVLVKKASQLLSADAVIGLHQGETSSSVTNVHTTLALLNAWRDEPLLISQLVRIASVAIASTAQWELLQATNVSDAELAMLQRDWKSMEFVSPMEKAFMVERVWASATIGRLRGSNSPSSGVWSSSGLGGSGGSGASGSSWWVDELKEMGETAKRRTSDTLWRVSWSYNDELQVLQASQVMVEALRQARTNGFFKDALAERERKFRTLGLNAPSANWLCNGLGDELWSSLMVSGGTEKTINRVLAAEVTRRVSIAAIALKRYQLRHGAWPSDLNALVPDFLSEVPRDPVDGQPLRYRLNSDGTFLLYSIGDNNNDDGGDATRMGSTSKTFYWLRGRDWVWPQPATPEEVQDNYDNPPK